MCHPFGALTQDQLMRYSIYSLALLASLFFAACGNSDQETVLAPVTGAFSPAYEAFQRDASAAEVGGLLMQRFSAISDEATGALNQTESKNFVAIAEALADKYPNDTLAALPLYRAAEVVRAMNDPKKAAAIYERIHNDYTSFSKAPEALFMLAFTYDENLNDLEAARETYERFLRLYPNNVFAESTPMLLENLGKSDEEILRQLEAQQQEQ